MAVVVVEVTRLALSRKAPAVEVSRAPAAAAKALAIVASCRSRCRAAHRVRTAQAPEAPLAYPVQFPRPGRLVLQETPQFLVVVVVVVVEVSLRVYLVPPVAMAVPPVVVVVVVVSAKVPVPAAPAEPAGLGW